MGCVRDFGSCYDVGRCSGWHLAWATSVGARLERRLVLPCEMSGTVAPENPGSDACVVLETDASAPGTPAPRARVRKRALRNRLRNTELRRRSRDLSARCGHGSKGPLPESCRRGGGPRADGEGAERE